MSNDINLRFRIDDESDLDAAQKVADKHPDVAYQEQAAPPADDDISGAVVPIVAVLIGAAVVVAAKFVTELVDFIRGGLVIDMRPGVPDNLYRDHDVPFGLIVVYARDGKVSLETKELPKNATERIVSGVLSGVLDVVEKIERAASDASSESNKSLTPGANSDDKENAAEVSKPQQS